MSRPILAVSHRRMVAHEVAVDFLGVLAKWTVVGTFAAFLMLRGGI